LQSSIQHILLRLTCLTIRPIAQNYEAIK